MKRILNLTHNDLDGIAAGAAVKLAHPHDHVVTKFCSYSDIHQEFYNGLTDNRLGYDRIILSDISIKVPGANFVDTQERWLAQFQIPEAVVNFTKGGGELVFLDHHEPQATKMSWYYRGYTHPFTVCRAKDELGYKRAGSELAGLYLKQQNPSATTQIALDFLELAGDYDVWRNPKGFGGTLAMAVELMNDHHSVCNEFLEIMQGNSPDFENCLPSKLNYYAGLAQRKYLESVDLAWNTRINHTTKITEVYANWFGSLVAMDVYDKTKGIVLVRFTKDRTKAKSVSLRRHESLKVHLGEFASQYGGGGHSEAAGIKVSSDKGPTVDSIIESLSDYIYTHA